MSLIQVNFTKTYEDEIFGFIKFNGVKKTESALIHSGFHPSFVRAMLKKIMRTRGW